VPNNVKAEADRSRGQALRSALRSLFGAEVHFLCRHCQTILCEGAIECWYCHRSLLAGDLISTEKPAWWRRAERYVPSVKEVRKPSDSSAPLALLSTCVILAMCLGLLYVLVRFVHWAWYQ
jgi:hypothetical protein